MSQHILPDSPLSQLRQKMAQHAPQIDAYLIPSGDEYLNEYIPAHLNRREWITGFTGSAGDALITPDKAYVFADGRYHEQVDSEININEWTGVKVGQKDALPLSKQLQQFAREGQLSQLAYPAHCTSARQIKALKKQLTPLGVELISTETHWVDSIWNKDGHNRPAPVQKPIVPLSPNAAGQGVNEKLQSVRAKMKEAGCQVLPLNMLDQIAWLFNLRGSDIPYNPVFLSYAIITQDEALLFLPEERLPLETLLETENIRLLPLKGFTPELTRVSSGHTVWADESSLTAHTWDTIQNQAAFLHEALSPVTTLKAVKNKAESFGMAQAHIQAGVAWLKARYWLDQQLKASAPVSEKGFADKLYECYAEREGFISLSFNTIAGMGEHGAIIHYGTPSDARTWKPGELFLVDSGAQFATDAWAGTTDTTRTWVYGEPTEHQKYTYTHVLQAHIAGSMQRFPQGSTGAQMDGIVRSAMWQAGLDFMHGTGHGVGAYLNVHEGPCGISKGYSTPLKPGMMVSMEPGYYEAGHFGIRLENVVEVIELEGAEDSSNTLSTTGEPMLGFQSLTMMPFEPELINMEQLTQGQKLWLKQYHHQVCKTLTPYLNQEEQTFLKTLCQHECH